MKIKVINAKDGDDIPMLRIEVDNKERVEVGHIEPEDAFLFRGLNFVYSIPTLMREAYEAAKKGEGLEIEEVDVEEEEFWG
tara:strand:+ start:9399 stop:9641 length:243 start_codon:yes stop_codon:yes gene_type:complete